MLQFFTLLELIFVSQTAYTRSLEKGNLALASSASVVSRKDLLKAIINKHVHHTEVKEVQMAAGQKAGLHLHPCPVVGVILNGTVQYQVEGESLKILKAGEAFYEPAGRRILKFDNASDFKILRFVAVYLVGDNQICTTEILK